MADQRRRDRLAEQLRAEISALVESAVDDPRVGLVTVTHVRLSNDLRHARIYVSLPEGANRRAALQGLDSARGFLRRQLSQRLPHLRRTPELLFDYDASLEKSLRVEALLDTIRPAPGDDRAE